jgi:hypothetical protein
MKELKQISFALILGLAATITVATYAQTASRTNANKTSESCCAMACCHDDSCCKGQSGSAQKDVKNHADMHGCCCSGESCDMKGDKKNHAETHGCCCAGDSCEVQNGAKNHAGCCPEDSSAMKNTTTAKDAKDCCCCNDSCDMKEMKNKEKQG